MEKDESKEISKYLAKLVYETSGSIEKYLERQGNDPIYFTWKVNLTFTGDDVEQVKFEKRHDGVFSDGEELKLKEEK